MSQSNTSFHPAFGNQGVSRVLLESVHEATLVADSRCRLAMMNRAAEHLTGWREEDVLGKPFSEVCHLIPVAASTFPLSPRDLPFRHWLALDTNDALEGRSTLDRRSGPPLDVAWRVIRIPSANGEADGFVVTLRGTATINALLDTVGESEYRRRIVEAEPACVKVVAPDGTLVDMNAAGLAMIQAVSLDEAQSQPLTEFISPSHRGN